MFSEISLWVRSGHYVTTESSNQFFFSTFAVTNVFQKHTVIAARETLKLRSQGSITVTSIFIIFNKTALRLPGGSVRAVCAGPVLRGQRFANEQILRGPALAARKGPVQACLQGCQ